MTLPVAHLDSAPPPQDRDPAATREPPANIEAEQALLAAVLANNRHYEAAAEILGPADFADPAHGRVFAACGTLIDRGQIANAVTLKNVFARDGDLDDVGGARYLADLQAAHVHVVPVSHYARQVRDMALRREVIAACETAVEKAHAVDLETSAEALVADLDTRLLAAHRPDTANGGPQALGDTLGETLSRLEARVRVRDQGGVPGVLTGLHQLDDLLGGLGDGWLVVVAGATSMGKTALATSIAQEVAGRGGVYFWSAEMTRHEVTERLLSGAARMPHEALRKGEVAVRDWNTLVATQKQLAEADLVIDDRRDCSVADLRHAVRREHRRRGLSLIVVDYLQQLRAADPRQPRHLQVAQMTREMKMLAQQLGVPILLLSQLSREVDRRENKRPNLGDLRESGAIEQDADVVVFAFREEYYLRQAEPEQRADEDEEKFFKRRATWLERLGAVSGTAEAVVAKHRHGQTGTARLRFDKKYVRFANLQRDEGAGNADDGPQDDLWGE